MDEHIECKILECLEPESCENCKEKKYEIQKTNKQKNRQPNIQAYSYEHQENKYKTNDK